MLFSADRRGHGSSLWLTALIGENVHTLEEGSLLWAVMGTILPLLITGGIHLDGYLDVTDARSSYGDRAKKLEILKDPHVGAFAVIGCGIYLLAYAGFFSLIPGKALPLIGGIYVLTRALSALALVNFPKAKKDGLAAAFSDGAKKRVVTLSMSTYLVLTAAFLWWYGGSVVLGVMAAGAGSVFLALLSDVKKRIWRDHRGSGGIFPSADRTFAGCHSCGLVSFSVNTKVRNCYHFI